MEAKVEVIYKAFIWYCSVTRKRYRFNLLLTKTFYLVSPLHSHKRFNHQERKEEGIETTIWVRDCITRRENFGANFRLQVEMRGDIEGMLITKPVQMRSEHTPFLPRCR
ncbi:hypothetical protein EVAR_78218_1 [Eumeta japonica]|uniref:Uncharacterized protein n=1 Tax=Eumeta variegata TaxID=151549 RepID=A0A4C1T313_EUMVA|nr:hypothetical protein EVAR_78218_1 [Eumeta japonica]